MKVSFLSIAQKEFINAIEYYNEQREGLGFEFANEVERTIHRIIEHPDAWPNISQNARRCRCNRFPYGIIYHQTAKEIIIIAVMNLFRKPDYWKNRT